MTLREKLEELRKWDAEEAMCDGTYNAILSGLIDVALAAEEFRSFMELHHIDAEVVRALSRLDKALE